MRYVPRLIPAGSAPHEALVEPLIANPPKSPLGEHELIPQVAWMVEVDGVFEHAIDGDLDEIRGLAIETMLDGELASEALERLPGVHLATNGTYAAELLIDPDHLGTIHELLKVDGYLAAAPRRGRLLVGGVGGGIEGMRAFIENAKAEFEAAPVDDRISPVALFVRGGKPTAVIGELQLIALAQTMR